MTDEDKKKPGATASSSPSSSSQQLDQSLVRVFGELEQTLRDLTSSVQNNTSVVQKLGPQVSELIDSIKARAERHDEHLGTILDALVKLTDNFDQLAQREGAAVGAAVDARNALIAAREQIAQGLQEVRQEITGKHPLYTDEGMPPALHKIADFVWPIAMRNRAGIVKIVMGASGFAGLAKLVHYYLTGQH